MIVVGSAVRVTLQQADFADYGACMDQIRRLGTVRGRYQIPVQYRGVTLTWQVKEAAALDDSARPLYR